MARSVIDILSEKGLLSKEAALEVRKKIKDSGASLDDVLAKQGMREEVVVEAKSELTGLPVVQLLGKKVQFEVLKQIPEESARFYRFVPIDKKEGVLEIGMVNPEDVKAQDALKFIANRLGLTFKIFLISPNDFSAVLSEYKSLGGEVTKALSEFEKEASVEEQVRRAGRGKEAAGSTFVEEAPITKMVTVILRHAVEGRASDVHIEPTLTELRVRFRVDGVLYTSLILPHDVHDAVVTRIKVMTNLLIDEKRVPQDGRFHARINEKEIDFRVSTFPTSMGEKVVLRILDPESGIATLEGLGLNGRNLKVVLENIKKPYGMILVTGPTGSGKSTTLYAILQILNQESRNIVSLEDPVEYYVSGVNQSQVRPEIGYTFATGLRHILRQDPDVIMVGEIRDKETAELAVHASLTGHLVLSTLHTNNAIGAIPRLIDMGVEPFLIPSTIACVMGQRLVRRLCDDSKKEVIMEGRIREIVEKEIQSLPAGYEDLKKKPPQKIFEGVISPTCPKGSKGRIGVFEALEMTPDLEHIILDEPTELKIIGEAKRQGLITMRQDGILKVAKGEIGLGELLEVI
ncbi:MAG: GspE/PulE family protein [bacterium]|nr:GspE/PulE family protein [bacterium]